MEHQLRSWRPRGPSAKLKARLFPGTDPIPETPLVFGGRWAWLAPVMGCFLVMMVLSESRSNQLGYMAGRSNTDWLAAVARDQSYAAYAAAGFHSEQNALQKDPIEWTNAPRLPDEVDSVNLPKTNHSAIH